LDLAEEVNTLEEENDDAFSF
jgi:hypothetical protein